MHNAFSAGAKVVPRRLRVVKKPPVEWPATGHRLADVHFKT